MEQDPRRLGIDPTTKAGQEGISERAERIGSAHARWLKRLQALKGGERKAIQQTAMAKLVFGGIYEGLWLEGLADDVNVFVRAGYLDQESLGCIRIMEAAQPR